MSRGPGLGCFDHRLQSIWRLLYISIWPEDSRLWKLLFWLASHTPMLQFPNKKQTSGDAMNFFEYWSNSDSSSQLFTTWSFHWPWKRSSMLTLCVCVFECCRSVTRTCLSLVSCTVVITHLLDTSSSTLWEWVSLRQSSSHCWLAQGGGFPWGLGRLNQVYLSLSPSVCVCFFSKAPEHMLCLQNGRYDHADRMFNR